MKIMTWIWGAVVIFVLCFADRAVMAQAPVLKRYGIESGVVEYKISGTEAGTEMIYFDQWGMREARYITTETKLTGLRHLLTIAEGEWIYRVDLDKKIGTKESDQVLKQLMDAPPTDDVPLAVHVFKSKGAQMIRQEEYAGKLCDVWELKSEGITAWVSDGLALKVESKTGNVHTVKTAIAVLEGAIPEDKFSIPEEIQFIDMNIDEVLLSRGKDRTQSSGRP